VARNNRVLAKEHRNQRTRFAHQPAEAEIFKKFGSLVSVIIFEANIVAEQTQEHL